MELAAVVFIVVVIVLTVGLVVGLFIWAAVEDGQYDRSVQARLGIRRRTRLGR